MVNHESYRDEDGTWLYPEQVERSASGATRRDTGAPIAIGRVEKMSKSRRNTISPTAIIERYGADTARWFVLSDSPPERDMEWTEAGVAGAARFTQRLFRLVSAVAARDAVTAMPAEATSEAADSLRRATHRAIATVTEALEAFTFNVAVARLYELASALSEAEHATADAGGLAFARVEAARMLCLLVAPMMPHLAETMLSLLEPGSALAAERAWPEADPALLAVRSVTIAVQIMGKLRGTIEMAPDEDAARVLAAAEREPNVQRLLDGRCIVKRIHVPNRIVNFVVAG